ncbi:MAG: polysaccharide biosynthesis/export family protein [Phycisphaeraceae bacterium]
MKRIWDATGRRWMSVGTLFLAGIVTVLTGCEVDSFFDPSVVGRWEPTPMTQPILDRLDVIDEPPMRTMDVTRVRPSDLIPDVREYVIGPGDLVTVTVFELIRMGEEAVQTRRVDETGELRLPIVGTVRAAGLSPTQLEQRVRTLLEDMGVLRDAMVSVVLQERQQDTFSVLSEPETDGTAAGIYTIPKPNFRLTDAVAMVRGVSGRTRRLLIYRQTALTEQVAGEVPQTPGEETEVEAVPEAPEDPGQLIDELMQGVEEPDAEQPEAAEPRTPQAPAGAEDGLEESGEGGQWVNIDGEWVRAESARPGGQARRRAAREGDVELGDLMTQRIIEIPWEKLKEGDLRYNIIIRPGDIIRVPSTSAGFVYVMGQINRPGAYAVPGENDLTLKQLIASAGGLGQLAIPERVDLIRRIDDNQEAVVRLDVRAIFEGEEPDIFIKPNDIINVGTSWPATPLAIIRNGFRATYGFGFVLDRNFDIDVFGRPD